MITCFQKKVYDAVMKIKEGEVRTYEEIAREIGTSARAVGNALKHNPNPIAVPCHRVIRSDGKLGGYTYKGKRKDGMKKVLLEKEKLKS